MRVISKIARPVWLLAAVIGAGLLLMAIHFFSNHTIRVRVRESYQFVPADDYSLMEAVDRGDLQVVRQQLDADPTLVKSYRRNGMTLLYSAAGHHRTEIVRLLVERGADVNAHVEKDVNGPGNTPLYAAVGAEDADSVRLLLDRGANPMLRNDYGSTTLEYARDAHPAMLPILQSIQKPR